MRTKYVLRGLVLLTLIVGLMSLAPPARNGPVVGGTATQQALVEQETSVFIPGEGRNHPEIHEPVRLSSPGDVQRKREQLIQYIWSARSLPDDRNLIVEQGIEDTQYASLLDPQGNLERIDQYTVTMEHNIQSVVYHFLPRNGNQKLFIYHAGHNYGPQWEDRHINGDGIGPGTVIPRLLREGYAVLAFPLLLYDGREHNTTIPTINQYEVGTGNVHDAVFFLTEQPFCFFFTPLVVALNYVEAEYAYSDTYMVGLSGGGWATTIYSAIDPRIVKSFPVAGSVPIPYRMYNRADLGDAEQVDPGFYRIANYTELYVMGSYGSGRIQTQILNYNDDCCFGNWSLPHDWVADVQNALAALGEGEYRYVLDMSATSHQISAEALEMIVSGANSQVFIPQVTLP